MKVLFQIVFISSGLLLSSCGNQDKGHGDAVTPGTQESQISPLTTTLGHEKGNGGDVVVCFNSDTAAKNVQKQIEEKAVGIFADQATIAQIKTIEVLDLYEFQLPSGLPPVVRPIFKYEGSIEGTLEKIIARVKTKSGLGDRLEDAMLAMPLGNWKASPGVVEIDDAYSVFLLPAQCLVVQAAVRQVNIVFYDQYIFSLLSDIQKVGLVTHELVYRLAADVGSGDSRHARQVNGLILSQDEWDRLSADEIERQVRGLGKFAYPKNFDGNRVWVSEISETYPDGNPRRYTIKKASPVVMGDKKFIVDPTQSIGSDSYLFVTHDGKIESFVGQLINELNVGLQGRFTFGAAGNLNRYDHRSNEVFRLNGLVWSFPYGTYEFNENGQILSYSTNGQVVVPYILGNVKTTRKITFFLGTNEIAAIDGVEGELSLAQGNLNVGGSLSFYMNHKIAHLDMVRGNLEFPNGTSKHYNDKVFWRDDGTIKKIEFLLDTESSDSFRWIRAKKFNFSGAKAVEFGDGNAISKIHLGALGKVQGSESSTYQSPFNGSHPNQRVLIGPSGEVVGFE